MRRCKKQYKIVLGKKKFKVSKKHYEAFIALMNAFIEYEKNADSEK